MVAAGDSAQYIDRIDQPLGAQFRHGIHSRARWRDLSHKKEE